VYLPSHPHVPPRYLAEVLYEGPVVVTNYPKGIKAFYMKLDRDAAPGRETVQGKGKEEDVKFFFLKGSSSTLACAQNAFLGFVLVF